MLKQAILALAVWCVTGCAATVENEIPDEEIGLQRDALEAVSGAVHAPANNLIRVTYDCPPTCACCGPVCANPC